MQSVVITPTYCCSTHYQTLERFSSRPNPSKVRFSFLSDFFNVSGYFNSVFQGSDDDFRICPAIIKLIWRPRLGRERA